MTDQNATDRRQFLIAAGGTILATSLAGCSGSGDGGGGDGSDDAGALDPGTTVEIEGYVTHWEGLAPSSIEGEENPTIVLEEGAEYTFEWVNGDGSVHNLEIWDDGEDVVDDLETQDAQNEGEGASLTFTASSEMTSYVCSYHQAQQSGELDVQ